MTPRVSVVMSVYNGLPHLDAAIRSLRHQVFTDTEFVVIDDGSTDGSSEVLKRWAADDPRVHLIQQENAGLTSALIRGVAEARGEYIARQDADDRSYIFRFNRQVALLDRNPDAVAATCALDIYTEDGDCYGYEPQWGPPLWPWLLTFHNLFAGHGQLMFRKAAYKAAGGYDPSFRYAQDFDLWNRLKRFGPTIYDPHVQYGYRIGNPAAISKRHAAEQGRLAVSVVRRELETYGAIVSEDLAREAHRFWKGRNPAPVDPTAFGDIDRAMRTTARAFLGQSDNGKHARALKNAVAARWGQHARWLRRSDQVVAAGAALRAAAWWI